jgi:hypothetical protein
MASNRRSIATQQDRKTGVAEKTDFSAVRCEKTLFQHFATLTPRSPIQDFGDSEVEEGKKCLRTSRLYGNPIEI